MTMMEIGKNVFNSERNTDYWRSIELFSFAHSPARPSSPEALGLRHLAFVVESVESFSKHLVSKGVEVKPIRIDEYTQRKYTFFTDPDGLPLELYEQ